MSATAVFDKLAENYDADFTTSRIGQLQRERVRAFLMPHLKKTNRPLKVLEINCGTGEDATWLSSMGHTVIATDASAVMIEKAKFNMAKNTTITDLQFLQCTFKDLTGAFEHETFDLVFSNFGGLNCIDKNALQILSSDLASLVKPAGHLFFVIMAKYCAWEVLYYGLKGKFKTAFRRIKNNISFTIDDIQMPLYYYNSLAIKNIFSKQFNYHGKKPVGLFIPPSYLEKNFSKQEKQLQRLSRWEKNYAPAALSSFADHYCISFSKTTATT